MNKRALVLVLVSFAGIPAVCRGQNATGRIVGTVTDSSGAALPATQITALSVETGDSRSVATDERGDYTFQLLNPGTYTVSAAAKGFTKAEKSGIILQVDRTDRADFVLSVGSETQVVSVNGGALTLDTDSPQVGQTIDEQQVTELPLNGRNFTDLLFLTPGAVQTVSEQNQFRYEGGGAISLGGARSGSNGYTIDGTSIMDYGYDTPAYNISLDAIQEFNVQTASYSAEYGYSANQVNISSKGGTNTYHGSVFEYIRNNAVDAKNYFLTSTQPLRQNQFGYSLGGPFWIPKIYNGHNRTFFFANYEGQRIRATIARAGTVPTASEVGGLFPFPVYDPLTGEPFPGNQIPASRISRLGQLIQSNPALWFPAPNAPGNTNYVAGVPAPVNTDQQNYRIDQQFGERDSAFVRAAKSDILATSPSRLTQVSDVDTIQAARNYTAVETHIFVPTLLNQFRIGYLEFQAKQAPFTAPAGDISALGFQNVFNIPDGGYPDLQFSTYSNPNRPEIVNANTNYTPTGAADNTPTSDLQSMWDIEDSVSWTKGVHTVNVGFGMRRITYVQNNVFSPQGVFSIDGEFSGNQISDLLLGNPQKVNVVQAGPLGNAITGAKPHVRFASYAPYVQDDWKASPKLTINAGLRYEYTAVPSEEQNSMAWFDPNLPGGGVYVANQDIVKYGGGLYVYPGRKGPGPAPKDVFAPRVGFAFRPFRDSKTVIRGGYGLFFDTSQNDEFAISTGIYPYYTKNIITASAGINLIQSDQLYPAPPSLTVSPTSMPSQLVNNVIKDPYIQDFTFDVQRELPANTVLDVGYVGTKGTDLMSRIESNQPTQCIPSKGCIPNPLDPGYVPVQDRNPYPNYANPLINSVWDNYSNYNALNVKVEHRGTDLTVLAAYTWSKGMDIKSSLAAVAGDAAGWIDVQDAHNPNADYARSSYDIGQRLAVSFIGQLPVGRGKKFLGNVNRATNAVIGGWQVSGIAIFQGGFPATVSAADIGFLNWAYAERADQVSNPFPSGFVKDPTQWFDTAAFAQPKPGYYGNSSRNALRMPGEELWNLAAAKTFKLNERIQLQVRVESFNAFNHPQFGFPDLGVNDSTFGTITSTSSPNRENQGTLRLTF